MACTKALQVDPPMVGLTKSNSPTGAAGPLLKQGIHLGDRHLHPEVVYQISERFGKA